MITKRLPLPPELLRDGIPYWQWFGGTAVTLAGNYVRLFSGYEGGIRETLSRFGGHCVTQCMESAVELRELEPALAEGELGIVVVHGRLLTYGHRGDDETRLVPQILHDLGEDNSQVVYAPLSPFSRVGLSEEMLLSDGYTAVAPYDHRPARIFLEVAQIITQLSGTTPPHSE
jgi:hypothetical protein